MKTLTNHIIYRFCALVLTLLYTAAGYGQTNPYYTVHYEDSLQKDPGSDFIYNNVTITNVYSKTISVNVAVNTPDGWHMLGTDQVIFDIAPGQSSVFPVVLSKLPSTLAEWLPVNIEIQLKNGPPATAYPFYVKAKIKTGYSAAITDRTIKLTDYQPTTDLKLYLRNKGNTAQHFNIQFISSFFELNKTVPVTLEPFTDTNVIYTLNISSAEWKDLQDEIVKLWITNDSGQKFYYTYDIKRYRNTIKKHESAYPIVPIVVEGGLSAYGNQLIYFGGVSGAIKINDESSMSFYYRSKEYGLYGYQPAQYLLTYNYKNWQFSAGMISPESPQFYTAGQGIKLRQNWKNGDYVSVYGIKHYADTIYSADCIGAAIRYHIHKLILMHAIGASFDPKNHLNSYLETNNIQILDTKLIHADVIAGVGFNHSTLNLVNNPNNVLGKSLGYDFSLKYKHIDMFSSVLYNDNDFPGVYSGYRSQNHAFNFRLKHSFIGLFYQSNYTSNNFFRDSIYVTNSILNNMTNYGIRGGWMNGNMTLTVGTGVITQIGIQNVPPHYQSFTLDYIYSRNRVNIQFNSLVGINDIIGQTSANNIAIITERGVVGMKYGGIQAYYAKMPNYYSTFSNTTTPAEAYNITTINYGPYVTFDLFRHMLSTRLQYNFTETTGQPNYSTVSGSLCYDNKKIGLAVLLSGMIPVTNQALPGESVNISIRKTLNIPVINHRRYYDLTVVVFNDEDGNGQPDKDEAAVKNLLVYINGQPLMTDSKGKLVYSNIEPGSYKVDFAKGKGVKGLMPTAGNVQVVNVAGNTTVYIPFKKGKLVSGKVTFHVDSAAQSVLTPDNIKIIAIDTSDKIYTTLTDDNGEYFFNLPSSVYKISLDPDAFDETIKPKQMSYNINLMTNEEAQVIFEIDKKRRQVKVMNVSL